MTLMAQYPLTSGGHSLRRAGDALRSPAAVVFEEPNTVSVRAVDLTAPTDEDVRIRTVCSGISTGTERLLYEGRMPPFPGLAYPLVPGYETVGEVVWAGAKAQLPVGSRVFVPGSACFSGVQALFGGASAELICAEHRAVAIPREVANTDAVLMSLAATAHHILSFAPKPDLVVGHGVLARLLLRLLPHAARDAAGVRVWEINPARRNGQFDYPVLDPADDDGRDLRSVIDLSGDPKILNQVLPRLAHRGEVVLGGFYAEELSFAFPPAFMREARIQVAAEFSPTDMAAVAGLISSGALRLDGLVTHTESVGQAGSAYQQAFADPHCLKMAIDWEAEA